MWEKWRGAKFGNEFECKRLDRIINCEREAKVRLRPDRRAVFEDWVNERW